MVDAAGFNASEERSGITWMDVADRPAVIRVADGFRVVDRASRPVRPHPLAARNGAEVERRLRQCALYDPELDLAVDTPSPSATSDRLGQRPSIGSVAYDEELADRIRALLPADDAVSEQAMFGGLAFLVGGKLALAASGQGGVLVRVDPAESEELMATTAAVPMEMRGRPMRGWLRLSAEQVRTKRQLSKWVGLGVGYASGLATNR